MDWQGYATEWRSLVWDHDLPQPTLPLEFVTPELAWDYGAITRVLKRPSAAEGSLVLKVRLRVIEGCIGVSVSKTNGSALVSREINITPEQGEADLYLELPPGKLPLSLLIRNYEDDGRRGRVHVQSVQALPLSSLDDGLKDQVAATVKA